MPPPLSLSSIRRPSLGDILLKQVAHPLLSPLRARGANLYLAGCH